MGPAGPAGAQGVAGPQGTTGAQGPPGSLYGEDAAQFAGFTTTKVNGALGGREQMHAACDAAFPRSHLCHLAEYELADSTTPVPSGGAWIDASGAADGSFVSAGEIDDFASPELGRLTAWNPYSCWSWSSTDAAWGLTLNADGAYLAGCSTSHVLACCSSPYRERFAGFTTATTTGAAGGRAAMHARCGQELPGSHLCHIAEYERATPHVTPPSSGAWIDNSGFATPSGGVVETALAASRLGRYTGKNDYENCDNWTATIAGGIGLEGLAVAPVHAYSMSCAAARPLACCL